MKETIKRTAKDLVTKLAILAVIYFGFTYNIGFLKFIYAGYLSLLALICVLFIAVIIGFDQIKSEAKGKITDGFTSVKSNWFMKTTTLITNLIEWQIMFVAGAYNFLSASIVFYVGVLYLVYKLRSIIRKEVNLNEMAI